MNLNFDKLVQFITPFAFLFVGVYLIATILFFVLPKKGVDYTPVTKVSIDYKNYDMSALFKKANVSAPSIQSKQDIPSLSTLELIAVYAMKNTKGWITIKEKRTQKTHTMETGEVFKGYILKSVYFNYAVFEYNGTEYKLEIIQNKKKFEIVTQSNNQSWKEKIILDGNKIQIKRKFFDQHITDFEKAWMSAKVEYIKTNSSMIGYKLVKIEKGSVIESLGLKQNDIIKKINNIKLNHYENAFKVYNNIKNINKLTIEVYRENRLLELQYEIN